MAADVDPVIGPASGSPSRTASGGAASGAAERRAEQARTWRARSHRVRRFRKLLPAGIAVVVVLMAAWIGGRGLIARLTTPKTDDTSVVRMVNPRFFGRDLQNRAFVVAARSAERPRNDASAISLKGPAMTLDAEGANPTNVKASHGVYREKDRRVTLDGGVLVSDERGYSFRTPRAVIDTHKGQVSGDKGVKGVGPIGTVAASSYGVYDRGERIIFKGGVRARIEQ